MILHPAYADPGYHRQDTVYVQDPNYNHYNRRSDTTVNDVTVNRDTTNYRTVNRTDVNDARKNQATVGEEKRKPTHKSLAQQQEQGNQQGNQ